MAEIMWFNYRKSPLGTSVREFMSTIVDVYSDKEYVEKDLENLKQFISANLKILDLDVDENCEKIYTLDPDLIDVIKQSNKKIFVLIATWTELDT